VAESLVAQFLAAGRDRLLGENREFFCIGLRPASRAALPPAFASGWHSLETLGDQQWRWSSGNAEIILYNVGREPRTVHLSGALASQQPRAVDATAIGNSVVLAPGENRLQFHTDVAADLPGNGDPRRLAFSLRNFKVAY
jgi:hypothetical protein